MINSKVGQIKFWIDLQVHLNIASTGQFPHLEVLPVTGI